MNTLDLPATAASRAAVISYEYPLNERIRILLRLEDLHRRVVHFAARHDPLDHHAALVSLFEVLDVAGRADLKSDLLQELERQRQSLETLRNNPAIEEQALTGVLGDIDRASRGLFAASGKIGQELRDSDWLMNIKQRTGIPGGVCEFDLPSYHYWLNQDEETRRGDLARWTLPFQPIYDALAIVLRLLRDSCKSSRHVARQGIFQQMLAGRVAQLVRLRLSLVYTCVPEISANKYALNVRFTTTGGPERSRVVEQDVEFELAYCNL